MCALCARLCYDEYAKPKAAHPHTGARLRRQHRATCRQPAYSARRVIIINHNAHFHALARKFACSLRRYNNIIAYDYDACYDAVDAY